MANFGQQMGSLKTLKKSLAKGTGSAWIKYIPKNGSMNVRFIQEPELWINYVEHYDQTLRKSYPCNGEASCPGCQTGERKSNRYLANALDVDQDRVIPLQLPKDLANRLVVRYEKNGTLTDRDFELSRSGDGLDTVYDLDAGMKDRKKLDKYKPLDLLKVLEDAWNDTFGPEEAEEVVPVAARKPTATRKRSAAAAKLAKTTEADDAEADENEEDDEAPVAKPAAKKAAAKKSAAKKSAATPPEPVFEADDEDDEADESDDVDADDGDDDGYDEESLRQLPLGALRAVAREFDVNPRGMGKDEIVDAILEAGDPVEEDDEIPF